MITLISYFANRIGDVRVSVLASCSVDHRFDPRSCQTIDYDIDSCCFSVQHATLKSKIKDWMVRNQICSGVATYLPADSFFSDLAL